jgi:omega-amidase
MGDGYRLALCQMSASEDRAANREKADAFIQRAVRGGAGIVVLPEMWNCPYDNEAFPLYAEPADGPSVSFLSDLAKKYGIILVGGSIPESDGGKLYNTCFVFDGSGALIGRHRKVHLFDIDVKGGIRFMESDTLSPGDRLTILDTAQGKIGVGICYDIRFPRMFAAMAAEGVHLVVLPGAFNMVTGPAHWDILIKSRALDNQIYLAACSPARDPNATYRAYGHSCISTPWGEYCAAAAAAETVAIGDIDPAYVEQVRAEIPVRDQQREDVYASVGS